MKKFIIQFLLLISVIGVSILFFNPSTNLSNFTSSFLPKQDKFASLQIGQASLKVEVADTASKRSKGLGGRQSLASDSGMLFVFDRADKYPFWMKGLQFNLDFVWIKGEEIVDILENVPFPQADTADSALPIYASKVEVDKVLEVNAGAVQRLNIKVGDKVTGL